ncbi:glycosyltransferase [Thiohalorhabdus sp. Cl-TMA]|uniref:Glycosyltransferase n=1 Tax=Thiohalorhabdus methylotrophus TaxID=3242694 RepID=A0ABV4TT92_9GAMM
MAPSMGGGIGRNMLNLARQWVRFGVDVEVLLQDFSGTFVGQLPPEVVKVPLGTTNSITGVPALAYYLFRSKPDVLLTTSTRHTVTAVRARALIRSRTRIFVNIHNTLSRALGELSSKKAKSRLKAIKRSYPVCDGIIPVSEGVESDFREVTHIRDSCYRVIYNPVDFSHLQALSRKPDPELHAFRKPGVPLLATVARLVPQKNIPLLLEAFALLRRNRMAQLVIVGDGKNREQLEEMAEESPFAEDILFMGSRLNPFNIMAASDAVVLSSSWEGLGNVLIEAMVLGVPVVSTDCPHGPGEVLESGRWGPLVAMDDPEALAAGMISVLDDPHSPESLNEAVAHMGAEAIAREYLAAFGICEVDPEARRDVKGLEGNLEAE